MKRKMLLVRARMRRLRRNMRNDYYRHEMWVKARIVLAALQWLAIVMLVHFFGGEVYFLGALVQALLLVSIFCGGLVLSPPPSPDPQGPQVFVNRMDSMSSLAFGTGTALFIIFAVFVLLMS